jgi:hypothetical protein
MVLFIFPLLIIVYLILPPSGVGAQTNTPKIETLGVSLWPEYDRPEVLVIYRVRLSPDTPLPAEVTFPLPGYVEAMHAVAIEEEGGLLNVAEDQIQLTPQGDAVLLTFPTTSAAVQFEYYDPVILSKQDQSRQLTYNFVSRYPIGSATFEVQQPLQATNFNLEPAASDNFADGNGLQYHVVQTADLAPDEPFELSVSYQRPTDAVSVQQLNNQAPSQTLETAPVAASTSDLPVGYLLIGAGVLLLAGSAGYWWWSNRQPAGQVVSQPQQKRRQSGRKRKSRGTVPAKAEVPDQMSDSGSGSRTLFCYQCGSALREDANFCHVCGAERRR